MFTWAIITPDNKVERIERATLEVPETRPNEHWVQIPTGTKWKEGLTYNPTTRDVE